VLGENAVDDLRDDGIAITENAGEELFTRSELVDEVLAKFVLNR
jgi:hypothetical protein